MLVPNILHVIHKFGSNKITSKSDALLLILPMKIPVVFNITKFAELIPKQMLHYASIKTLNVMKNITELLSLYQNK
jgi:hypothetical protein